MQFADTPFSEAQIIKQGNNVYVQHGTDAGLHVEFYMESLQDEEKSVEAGRPIFFEREFVKVQAAGDKNNILRRPVKYDSDGGTPPDNERWPRQYTAFKNKQEQPHDGTPITEWPPITKSQALELKGIGIHTVEALAAVADTNLHNIGMEARILRDKAAAYLKQAQDGSELSRLTEENKELRLQLEAARNQIAAISDQEQKAPKFKKFKGETENA